MDYELKALDGEIVNHHGRPGLLVFRCPNCRGFLSFRLQPYPGGFGWTGNSVESLTLDCGLIAGGHLRAFVRDGKLAAEDFTCRPVN